MADIEHEGWFTDPYGIHDARWLSQGTPTKLVRDGDVESYDDPPDEAPPHEPERIEPEPVSAHGDDLRRADDAEAVEFDREASVRAAWDAFDQSGQ